MRPRRMLLALAAAAVTGCNDGGGPLSFEPLTRVEITVAPAVPQFAPAGPIVMHVVNASDGEYNFNTCFWRLMREQGGRWVSVTGREVCNAYAQRLPPRSTVTGTLHVPDELPQGQYRFVTQFGYVVEGHPREHVQLSEVFAIGK